MLPDLDYLFDNYIKSNYPDDYPAKTLSDMMGMYKSGLDPRKISNLEIELQDKVMAQMDRMVASALSDWGKSMERKFPSNKEAIIAFDEYYNEKRVCDLIEREKTNDLGESIFITAIEVGAVCGAILREVNQEWHWLPCLPYWESPMLHIPSGNIANVFHWGVKKLSNYGIDDGLYDKILACNDSVK